VSSVNSVGRIDDSPQTQFTSREPPAPDPTASFLPALVNRGLALRSAPPVAVDDDAYHADSDDFYDCEIMSVRCAA